MQMLLDMCSSKQGGHAALCCCPVMRQMGNQTSLVLTYVLTNMQASKCGATQCYVTNTLADKLGADLCSDKYTSGQTHKQRSVVLTCVLAEGALDIGRSIPHIGLPKGCHKALCQLHLCLPIPHEPFVLTAASRGGPFGVTAASGALFGGPLLQELGGDPLVVTADEVVGVVDGGAVHGEPADGACA